MDIWEISTKYTVKPDFVSPPPTKNEKNPFFLVRGYHKGNFYFEKKKLRAGRIRQWNHKKKIFFLTFIYK